MQAAGEVSFPAAPGTRHPGLTGSAGLPALRRGAGGSGPWGPLPGVQATAAPPAGGLGWGGAACLAFLLQTGTSLGLPGAAASPFFFFSFLTNLPSQTCFPLY